MGAGLAGEAAGFGMAAEVAGAWDGSGPDRSAFAADMRLVRLREALGGVLDWRVDEIDDSSLRIELDTLEHVRRRLEARRAEVISTLARRQAERAATANPKAPERSRDRARRQTRQQLADQLGLSPSEAKQSQQLGDAIDRSPEVAEAVKAGDIPTGNATTLSRTVARLDRKEHAQAIEELMDAARRQDPVAFGRTCRQLLARLVPADEADAEQRRHRRRKASLTRTPEGMTRIYAELAGADGALASSAIHAFRRLDLPREMRRPEQATADALVDVFRAALASDDTAGNDQDRAPGEDAAGDGDGGECDATAAGVGRSGEGPPRPRRTHGVRPHVVVTIPIDVLQTGSGPVDIDGDTIPLDAIRHLLDDAGWSFVLTDRHGTPAVVTSESRTVPVGLWRALQLRDQTCIAEGCDMPARWCDVMHLRVPHRDGGRLDIDSSALGCRTDHRAYDNGHLELSHDERGHPVLRRPADIRSRAGPSP